MKPLIITMVFITLLFHARAQDPYEDISMPPPDTFHIFKPKVRYVNSLDTLGEIMDSIAKPKTYIINRQKSGSPYSWLISIKQKNKYAVFDPLENNPHAHNLTFDTQQLNGKGSEELILEWHFYAGHTNWEYANHENKKGKQIWDLDKIEKLFDLGTYYSQESWWTNYAEDTTGSIPFSEREVLGSGSEHLCYMYVVSIGDRHLILQKKSCSTGEAKSDIADAAPTIYMYRLTRKGLIKQK